MAILDIVRSIGVGVWGFRGVRVRVRSRGLGSIGSRVLRHVCVCLGNLLAALLARLAVVTRVLDVEDGVGVGEDEQSPGIDS